ncbi:MAG: AmpG family muropeptide MFS transporter [Oligoflexales bacterium]
MRKFLQNLCNIRLIMALVMGISSGMPLLITITLMQAWAKEAGVDLKTIGMMSLVGLPYTVKFLWSPLFDRFSIPLLGRRRGWLLITQFCLCIAILLMGYSQPEQGSFQISYFVISAALIAFFSASQDIVIDAYRREDLKTLELGIGSSYYIYGYRIGMILSSSGGLILSDFLSWKYVFMVLAGFVVLMMGLTIAYKEPKLELEPPKNFRESVIDPFIDYFKRDSALLILTFILLYKLGDTMASAISTPFYLEIGYTKTEIGSVVKLFGFWATIIGSFLGGSLMLKYGIRRSLWSFGFLQMASTAGFALLAIAGKHIPLLAGVIAFENLSAGMGTAAFVAFMASMTNKKYTATQYALLSSLMGVPRVLVASLTGFMVEYLGWFYFFISCTLIAIPGMLLLLKFRDRPEEELLETASSQLRTSES